MVDPQAVLKVAQEAVKVVRRKHLSSLGWSMTPWPTLATLVSSLVLVSFHLVKVVQVSGEGPGVDHLEEAGAGHLGPGDPGHPGHLA